MRDIKRGIQVTARDEVDHPSGRRVGGVGGEGLVGRSAPISYDGDGVWRGATGPGNLNRLAEHDRGPEVTASAVASSVIDGSKGTDAERELMVRAIVGE
jgi:hypothetical protein